MKMNTIRIITLLLVIVCCYTACKKSATTTPTGQMSEADAAKQIALNLNESLTGQLGGASINDGIKAPSSITPNHKTKSLNSLNPLCGLVIDTAYTSSLTLGDTTQWISTKFHFVYNCGSSYVNGYTVYDSLKSENQSPKFLDQYTNVQNYTLKATDSTYVASTLNGSIVASIAHYSYSAPNVQSQFTSVDCNYQLSGLAIVNANGGTDITKGSATFTSEVRDTNGPVGSKGYLVDYAGSIQYIGNHQAKLYITGGHTYLMNFSTGTVTQL